MSRDTQIEVSKTVIEVSQHGKDPRRAFVDVSVYARKVPRGRKFWLCKTDYVRGPVDHQGNPQPTELGISSLFNHAIWYGTRITPAQLSANVIIRQGYRPYGDGYEEIARARLRHLMAWAGGTGTLEELDRQHG